MATGDRLKITIVGDGACGKTCSLYAFAERNLPEKYEPTIFEHFELTLNINGNPLSIDLNDTAGQEDFERLRPLAYPGTDAFIMLYDISNPISLLNIFEKWIPEVRAYSTTVPIVLAGNKSDLRNDQNKISELQARGMTMTTFDEAMQQAKESKEFVSCLEYSAMTNLKVKEVFMAAASFGHMHKNNPKKIPAQILSDVPASKPFCNIL